MGNLRRTKEIPVRSIRSNDRGATAFDSFRIRSLKEILNGKDMQHDLHRHDFYFILAITKGAGIHEIDFIEYKIASNSIFFIRPGQVHKLHLKTGSEGFLIEFNKDFQILSPSPRGELLRKAANRNFCKPGKVVSIMIHSALETILEEYKNKQENYQHAIKANLDIFFIQLLRARQGDQGTAHSASLYQHEKLQGLLDLLEANISTIKRAAAYADMLSLSHFQLNSITKSLLGKTVAELIEDQVILEAKRYLLATSNQVNQIAAHLGYEDASYFIRFFKKRMGQSPESFRQNFR